MTPEMHLQKPMLTVKSTDFQYDDGVPSENPTAGSTGAGGTGEIKQETSSTAATSATTAQHAPPPPPGAAGGGSSSSQGQQGSPSTQGSYLPPLGRHTRGDSSSEQPPAQPSNTQTPIPQQPQHQPQQQQPQQHPQQQQQQHPPPPPPHFPPYFYGHYQQYSSEEGSGSAGGAGGSGGYYDQPGQQQGQQQQPGQWIQGQQQQQQQPQQQQQEGTSSNDPAAAAAAAAAMYAHSMPPYPYLPSVNHGYGMPPGGPPGGMRYDMGQQPPPPPPPPGPAPQLVRTTALSQAAMSLGGNSAHGSGGLQAQQQHDAMLTSPQFRASLELAQGQLESLVQNWTMEEWQAKRRLVQFSRAQRGAVISAEFFPLEASKYTSNTPCVSCIYWEARGECFVTSVDCIYLLEQLVNTKFTVEEKNRIRRNLEGYHPLTVSKGKQDSGDFFRLIMSFSAPKPRNIEKDVKVFPWKILSHALKKIISKYSADYGHTTNAAAAAAAMAAAPPPPPPPMMYQMPPMAPQQQQQQQQRSQQSTPQQQPAQPVGGQQSPGLPPGAQQFGGYRPV